MSQDVSVVEKILLRYPSDPSYLIMVLQDIQAELNYVPKEAIDVVAEKLNVPRSRIYSTASFYKTFSLEPLGNHQVDVCMGTACHVRGAERLVNHLSDELNVKPGGTTKDREVTLNTVHCVGACALGPVVIMDGEYHGEMSPLALSKTVKKRIKDKSHGGAKHLCKCADAKASTIDKLISPNALANLREKLKKERAKSQLAVSICAGSGCRAMGSDTLIAAFNNELNEKNLNAKIRVQKNGCHGFCERGLICVIRPQGIFYQRVKPEDVPEIVEKTLKNGEIIDRLLYVDPKSGEKIVHEKEIPFYARQTRLLLNKNALIDPLSIEDYIVSGGYEAMAKALFVMTPDAIIDEVKKAGLRGRGGGGFHAAKKWASSRKVKSDKKYILCNADEQG